MSAMASLWNPLTPAQIAARIGTVAASFKDNLFSLKNGTDTTKVGVFSLSGLTTATTRTFTLPDATTALAGLSYAQTWAANQSFPDNLFTLQDDGDATKKGQFQLSGLTTATTRTWTMPNASTTLAGLAVAQTFTAVQSIDFGTGAHPGGITTAGQSLFLAAADGSVGGRIAAIAYGNSAFSFNGLSAGGTRAAPSYTAGGSILCRFNGQGYDQVGSAFSTQATLSVDAPSTWTAANRETVLYFSGTPNGSTVIAEWFRAQNGNLLIGGSTNISGTGGLKVFGATAATSTTSGALQVAGGVGVAGALCLDGSAGAGLRVANTAANAAVAVTLGSVGPTGSTAGNPQGWLRVNIAGTDRYIPFW